MNNSYPFAQAAVSSASALAAVDAEIASNKASFDAAMVVLNAKRAALTQPVANGAFIPGLLYKCVFANPKAKKGLDGKPRFSKDTVYLAIANSSSTSETSDVPPVFLIDNNYRSVNCSKDAKLNSQFVLA